MDWKRLNRRRVPKVGGEVASLSHAELAQVRAAGDPDTPKDAVRPPIPPEPS